MSYYLIILKYLYIFCLVKIVVLLVKIVISYIKM